MTTRPEWWDTMNMIPRIEFPEFRFARNQRIGDGWWTTYGNDVVYAMIEDMMITEILIRPKQPIGETRWRVLWRSRESGSITINQIKERLENLIMINLL